MEWTDKTAFGYCPICNGPVGDASQSCSTRKRYFTRILYCIDSIPGKGKHLYAPWQPPESEMTSSHFYQRFEEEHYLVGPSATYPDANVVGDECRRWDMRMYRKGNAYFEICYRTIDIGSGSVFVHSEDTLIQCDGLQVVFERVVKFDSSLDKIIGKMRSLLNLT